MFYACLYGKESIVKYLIEHGANINITSHCGEVPLFNACFIGNEVIVKYLVEHGADVNKKNFKGKTPLYILHVNMEMKT